MKISNFCIKFKRQNLISMLNTIVSPVYQELPFVFFFMKLMGLSSIFRLMAMRYNAVDDIDKYPSLFNLFGRIAILFLFAYVAVAIMAMIKNKIGKYIFKVLSYIVALLLFSITFFLFQNFALEISPICFVLLAETTGPESSEFINQYVCSDTILPLIKVLAMYVSAIISAEVIWYYVKQYRNRFKNRGFIIAKRCFSILVASFLLFGLFSTNIYWRVYNAKSPDFVSSLLPPKDPISSIYISMVTLQMMKDNVKNAVHVNKSVYNEGNIHAQLDDSVNIVVVVGESYIKWHSQLYGYSLATTPYLSNEQNDGRLFVFNDVITSSKSTSIVMREIFSCNGNGIEEQWYDYPTFLTIFRKAGYNVYFWDNQRDFDPMATYSFTLNSFIYNPELLNVMYTRTNGMSYKYDAEIIDSFNSTIDVSAEKHNLILFHLQGQHVGSSQRFPHETFARFTADSIKRDDAYLTEEIKEYIADYDNATLYNDYVMGKIFETFKNSNTVLVYFSDHGDEAYDYRKQCGRDYGEVTPMSLKYQFEIPFMIWCSDVYKEKNPDVIHSIKKALNRPFVIDNIHNMLFRLGGISTSYYKNGLDLLSPDYNCKERFIKLPKGEIVYEKLRYSNE